MSGKQLTWSRNGLANLSTSELQTLAEYCLRENERSEVVVF